MVDLRHRAVAAKLHGTVSDSEAPTPAERRAMHRHLLASAVLLLLTSSAALADDRPLTDDERTKLMAAISAEGCSGGTFEFDDGHYEVDDARCSDGHRYDLKFDASLKLIEKDRDD
jgi:hypothetical protein